MPNKRNGDRELLIRIDERVKVLPEIKKDVKEIREEQIRHCEALKAHHDRIKKLEKAGIGYNFFKLLGFLK